jgi:hypothetical protein
MLDNKSLVIVLVALFAIGLTSLATAGGIGSGELDQSFEVVKAPASSPPPADSFTAGLGSGELDPTYDVLAPASTSSQVGDGGIRAICSTSLGASSESHAADYCKAIHAG